VSQVKVRRWEQTQGDDSTKMGCRPALEAWGLRASDPALRRLDRFWKGVMCTNKPPANNGPTGPSGSIVPGSGAGMHRSATCAMGARTLQCRCE
jgi:hypothetical protein